MAAPGAEMPSPLPSPVTNGVKMWGNVESMLSKLDEKLTLVAATQQETLTRITALEAKQKANEENANVGGSTLQAGKGGVHHGHASIDVALKTSSRGFASTNQTSETSGQQGGLRKHNLSSLTQESADAPAHLKTWGELITSERDDVDCTSFPASARPWCRQLQASHFGCRAKLLDTWHAPRAAATTPYMFEKVYVVHYTKRPWRKLRMLDRLQGVGINTSDAAGVVSFVDAFDRETISTSILHCFNCAAVIDRQSGLPKPPGDKQTTGQCSAHIKHFVARLDMIRLLYEPYLSPVP